VGKLKKCKKPVKAESSAIVNCSLYCTLSCSPCQTHIHTQS